MKNKFKIQLIFIIFITLCALTFYNYYVIYTKNFTSNRDCEKVNKRINQIGYMFDFNSRIFPSIKVKNLNNQELLLDTLKKDLIILLSNIGCNACQVSELKNLQKIFDTKQVIVKGIYLGENKFQLTALKKLSDVTFELFTTNDEKMLNFNSINKYPVILQIRSNIIVNSFIPIIGDENYSKWFYQNFNYE